MRKKSFNEGLLKSSSTNQAPTSSNKLVKHPSQNSLVATHNQNVLQHNGHSERKLVSSKSISSPLSNYVHTANSFDGVRQNLKKKFQQSVSTDRAQDQQESPVLTSLTNRFSNPTSDDILPGQLRPRPEKLLVRGYLNKFSKIYYIPFRTIYLFLTWSNLSKFF